MYVPHLLRHGTSIFKAISERPVILTSTCRAFDEGAITIFIICSFASRCFTYCSKISHLYGDVTITGEGLQNLDQCSALREGSLSCHTCCDTGPRFFRSHPKDRHILSPLTTHQGM
jgi:hypothetical protein